MTASEPQKSLDELKEALDEFGLRYEEKESELRFSVDAPGTPTGIVDVSFFASEDGKYVRAQAFSPGATLPHEKLPEAFQYANLWNAHRSFSRIVVDNVKGPGDLSFVADSTFYTNAPCEPGCLRACFFERFIPSAIEFFETIARSLQQTDPAKEDEQ
ncbi:MAG: hypothetical protein IK077_05775 [Thermoguttaceae bacterium]|nr:hypothetical protein [Thermoguttaceae bacterium]